MSRVVVMVIFKPQGDAEKARGLVRKVNGRVVQIVFADKRPVKKERRRERGREERDLEVAPEMDVIE